jgi:pimeloyl-ACP methyl ester carboxylesterase
MTWRPSATRWTSPRRWCLVRRGGVAVVGTYAARHPQQPGKLIFSGGAARRVPEIELAAVERIAGKAARELGERYYRDQTSANEDAYDAAIRPFVSGRPPEDHTLRRISPAAPGLMEHWDAGEARTHDLRPGLANVICSTLILAGERDPVCPWELSLELAQAIDPELCRLEILPEGKHTLFYEAPQSLTLIRDFLLS